MTRARHCPRSSALWKWLFAWRKEFVEAILCFPDLKKNHSLQRGHAYLSFVFIRTKIKPILNFVRLFGTTVAQLSSTIFLWNRQPDKSFIIHGWRSKIDRFIDSTARVREKARLIEIAKGIRRSGHQKWFLLEVNRFGGSRNDQVAPYWIVSQDILLRNDIRDYMQ
jgi:hypothetical protein